MAADDIELLLNEFEADIENTTPKKNRLLSTVRIDGESSSDDLSDLLNLTPPLHHSSSKSSKSSSSSTTPPSRKCNPVYISGSGFAFGYSTNLNPRSCDRLICLDCDFNICIFPNFKWKEDTDYLFLRNNSPEFHRLKSQLRMSKGWNAYCCQCHWRHTNSMKDLNVVPSTVPNEKTLKWICTKH